MVEFVSGLEVGLHIGYSIRCTVETSFGDQMMVMLEIVSPRIHVIESDY